MKTAVVCAGPADPGFIRAFLTETLRDFLIAADRGSIRSPVQALCGSHPGRLRQCILGKLCGVLQRGAGAGIRRFPVQKDFTDAEAALKEAVARKNTEITVLGATGGRLDHFYR